MSIELQAFYLAKAIQNGQGRKMYINLFVRRYNPDKFKVIDLANKYLKGDENNE